MKKLNVIYSPKYLNYGFGSGHPFWPERAFQFLTKLKNFQFPINTNFQLIRPKPGKDADILLVHTKDFLERVKKHAQEGGALSVDTPVTKENLEAAYYYVGGTILASNLALKGERVINLLGGLHHAGSSTSSGFCIFNDHAIAIRKLQKEGKIKKAMIFDLDVHAGNGTQEIFYSDSSVFTISIHQDPTFFYPGTGFSWQKGEGKGKGYNLNLSLPAGTGEKEYLKALDSVLPLEKKFEQDLVFLILGVDTYKGDPLAGFKLEKETYQKIGQRFSQFEKLAVLFAGGYSRETPDLWFKFLEGYLRKC
ncbi:histone deacetylase family protein [Candidatus Microgenomates bacterium]|nr:histone deacetylase family protein [Candidatus Microgenomates bacterium]